MITFESTNEIFGFVEKFHRQIKELYDRLEQKQEDKRVTIFLQYLKKIRSIYEHGLSYYRKKGTHRSVNVWFQYVPDIEQVTIKNLSIDDLESATDLTLEDVVAIELELENRLHDFYHKLSENTNVPDDVHEEFHNLAEQESQEKAELIKMAEDIRNL